MDSIKEMLEAGRAALARTELDRKLEQEARDAAAAEKKDRQFAPFAEAVMTQLPAPLAAHADGHKDEFANGSNHHATISIPGLVPFQAHFHVDEWVDRNDYIGRWSLGQYRIPGHYTHRTDDGELVVVESREREWRETTDASVAVALAFDAENHRQKLQLQCVTENALAKERRAARLEREQAEPTTEETLIAALRRWVLDVVPVPAE